MERVKYTVLSAPQSRTSPWNPDTEEQTRVLMIGGDCLYFCVWFFSEIKMGSWSWILIRISMIFG